MKKKFLSIFMLLIFVVVFACSLFGCASLTAADGYDNLRKSLQNTLSADNAHIFYWKESVSSPREGLSNNVVMRKVNVLCDIDRDYDFIKNSDADYDYSGLKLMVTESENDTVNKEVYCGYSSDGVTRLVEWDKSMGTNGQNKNYKITEGVTARDYVKSEAFAPYTLATILGELDGITAKDIVYDGVSGGGVQRKGHVVTIKCKLSEAYLARYKEQNGKDSLLDGKYVTFETCYDRISAIIVYKQESGGGLFNLEYESYKLEVVYTGPKFDIPK